MLESGTRLGPYEILALVGEGGMGQVFKARDTRLDRTVAIKMLPDSLASDPVRRERFEREARNISRLEHPHICPLYDVGEHEGHAYLVMQFLEGETLADRVQRGPLTIGSTLEYGIQIAEALAAAHRAGIVHRDLKPGNVMLTRSGARLLDFGLARTVPTGPKSLQTTVGDRSNPSGLTTEGTILGTLSYMAPEQLDGRALDTRVDVFAFGAVLFEMVTGLKAFEGETPARVMSAILRDEPARVSSIVPVTPAALEALIHACLAKDPNDRWQNIADVARQLRHLRDMMSGPKSGSLSASAVMSQPVVTRQRVIWSWLPWVVAAILGALAAVLIVDRVRSRAPAAPPLALHALILPPEGMYLTDTLALSPDGRTLAFVAADPTGRRRLWIRALQSNQPQSLANTDGASDPFWSPDGQQIAFFAGGRLERVPASGGAITTVCEAGTTAGGSWGSNDVIIFAQQDGPMMRVNAGGGRPEPLTSFDREREETHHLWPAFLPDSQHYLFYVNSRERGVYIGELGSSARTRLFDPDPALPAAAAATPGVYSNSGHVLYVRDRALMARRFDLATLTTSGEPVTVAQTVDYDPPGQSAFTVVNGVLVYRARQHRPLAELVWVDRAGRTLGTVQSPPGSFRTMSLSPDGRTLAIDRRDAQGLPSVWLIETEDGTSRRLTSTYWSGDPLWSPDGRTLAYSVAADSAPNLVVRADRGQAPERRVTRQAKEIHYATSFTPDGRQIVYQGLSATTGSDLYVVSATDEQATPQRLLQTSANEGLGRVSPDGRWLAYVSDESGHSEIYVSRFPELQGKTALSSGGGNRPFWRSDGRELFYLGPDGRLFALAITSSGSALTPARPIELFRTVLYGDVYTPDATGQRFLLARPAPAGEPVPFEILVNPFTVR
jgi:eukaryotic-like serine/threonine-protein kinase